MKEKAPYQELGEDFFEKLNSTRLTHYYQRNLEKLGYEVTVTPKKVA
jgi:hypothetical protein